MARISITTGVTGGNKRRAATHYGRRDIEDLAPSSYAHAQGISKLEYTFSFDDLPTFDLDELIQRVSGKSVIKSAHIRVIEAAVGGTSYDFGLYQPDGTLISVDGIDAAVLTAELVDGAHIECDGALVGLEIGPDAGQLVVAATGTFTAGKLQVVLEIEEYFPRA
tara:strand:+ start:211 stop:705 length:495 start_codon:yes stop_codon:yes gene_type:complete